MSKVQTAFLPPMQVRKMVIAEFDQSQTAEFPKYAGGFCAGLTLNWLGMRVRSENWPAKQGDGQTAINATTAAILYDSYTKFHDGMGKPGPNEAVSTLARGVTRAMGLRLMDDVPTVQTRTAIDSVAGGLKLELDPSFGTMEWVEGTPGHSFIHELVVRGYGFYYLSLTAHITGKPDGSHAIGLDVFNNSHDTDCDLFDPNVGQLHFGEPSDIKWAFYDLLQKYASEEGITFYKGVAFRLREKIY